MAAGEGGAESSTHTHTNALDAITEQQNGIILIKGKVSLCREDKFPTFSILYTQAFSCVWGIQGTSLGKGLTI